MKIAKITRVVLAGGLAAAALAVAAPSADADLDLARPGIQLMTCTGSQTIATINPAVKDGTAATYVKIAVKKSDGTKTVLGGNPIPADATVCTVDAGIRTTQPAQDIKYLLDNQTNSNATLNLLSIGGSLIGSTACDDALAGAGNDYPTAYPTQGKVTYKFTQLDAALKNIQMQVYQRAYTDPDELNPAVNYSIGIVIKGVAAGSQVNNTTANLPTDSTKNINFIAGCSDGIPGNAQIGEAWAFPVDGVDANGTDDLDTWTLGHDDANAMP